jgi:hypothetical protein
MFYRVLGTDRRHWCQLVTTRCDGKTTEDPSSQANAARRPTNARTRAMGAYRHTPSVRIGETHGESVLWRSPLTVSQPANPKRVLI